jgi:hypothetical protein
MEYLMDEVRLFLSFNYDTLIIFNLSFQSFTIFLIFYRLRSSLSDRSVALKLRAQLSCVADKPTMDKSFD